MGACGGLLEAGDDLRKLDSLAGLRERERPLGGGGRSLSRGSDAAGAGAGAASVYASV